MEPASPGTNQTRARFRGRLSSRLFSWRAARRTLVVLAGLVTLAAAFHTEENWRGKRAWENCKRELEARGAVLDWSAYIPPLVPDEQNIFKAPKMQEWFVKGSRNPTTTELSKRLSNPNTIYAITTEKAAADYLAWSDQLESDFNLIREAVKRPYARMDGSYEQPHTIPTPDFVAVRSVAQTLAQRAKCYLLLGQPEKALRELTLIHGLSRLLEARPTGRPMTLVAAMINVAVVGLYMETVADGMRSQAWRDPQLTALQEQLSQINLLPLVAEGFRGEQVGLTRTLESLPRSEFRKIFFFGGRSKNFWQQDSASLLLLCAPRGWFYQNMVAQAQLLQKVVEGIDTAKQMVLAHNRDEAAGEIEATFRHFSPFTFIAARTIPNFLRASQSLARSQTVVNLGLISCALERYRLVRGEYPQSLDSLAPQLMGNIPHDVIGGQPLHYRRTDDGKFLLYSVGWNGKDDGGVVGLKKYGWEDLENGDWVWSYPTGK